LVYRRRERREKVIERERITAAAGRPIRDRHGERRVALSNESIYKTLVLLANVLDTAVEHGLLANHPARGKRRRLKADRANLCGSSKLTSSPSCPRSPANWIASPDLISGSAGGR
jgi:hypothetical protein